jgi:hypothetical protein
VSARTYSLKKKKLRELYSFSYVYVLSKERGQEIGVGGGQYTSADIQVDAKRLEKIAPPG